MRVSFTKMEGLGNDYLFVDAIAQPLALERAPAWSRRWSDRRFGVGSDGVIALLRGDRSPVRMAMWNADGSRGAMCGNGLRCLARFARARGHVDQDAFDVETDAGVRHVELLPGGAVRAGMGAVRLSPPRRVAVGGVEFELTPADVGNPHAVLFVADPDAIDVARFGAALQRHPDFPDGVNVEFVAVAGPDRLRQRTFERGSGETLACGTGAAAAVVAARARGLVGGDQATVALRGGDLRVLGPADALAIEGPARSVFEGVVETGE